VKRFSWIAAGVIAGGLYCTSLQAQSALAAALESAWERSVQSKSVAGQLGRARAMQSAAGALWAAPPSLELLHRGDPLAASAGQRESEIGLAWPLLMPGVRSARGAAAQADLETAEAGESAARLRLAGELREAVWGLQARRAELQLAQAQAQSLDGLLQDVARRVAAGDSARTDLLAAQAERAAALSSASEAAQRLAVAAAQWRLLTGLEPPQDPGEDAAPMPASHPLMRVAELGAEAAQKRLELVRATRRDAPEIMVRYRNELPAANFPAENSIGIGLRFAFGTGDRNQPREAAALAELDVARAEARRLREQIEIEIAAARLGVATAQEQLSSDTMRAVALRERASLLDRSFRAGETPVAELLRTLAGAAQADLHVARRRSELGLAGARLQQAMGALP
jgi:outer membrane protein, heavy metal efflux system